MFVLGVGLGMVMQVLVLAVQNAVEYRDLGTATSAATFFRTIGSCIGVAVFSTVFTTQLTKHLAIGVPPTAAGNCSPAVLSSSSGVLAQCPAAVQEWFTGAYATAIHVVFLSAVPVGIVAFGLAFLLPEVRLRTATRTSDPARRLASQRRARRWKSCSLRCLDTSVARTDCGATSCLPDGRA